MRRLLAILLLAAFGLPAVAPLLAFGQDAQSSLPACCRRAGAHHCAGGMQAPGDKPAVTFRCASFPQPSATTPHGTTTALLAARLSTPLPQFTLSASQRADTQRRLSLERSRHKRGPPATLPLA